MMDTTAVRENIRCTWAQIDWELVADLDRAINWELWHGTLPDGYWSEVEPLEHYVWRGFEQAMEDLRAALDSLPGEVYVDDEDWVYVSNPFDDEFYWVILEDDEDAEPTYTGPEIVTAVNPAEITLHKETWNHYH